MVSLQRMRAHFNLFSIKESISRQTDRKTSRKRGIRSQIAAQKLNLKREQEINRHKWCKPMKISLCYWQHVVFTDETGVTHVPTVYLHHGNHKQEVTVS